jgi:signal recognition particle subunit SRP54
MLGKIGEGLRGLLKKIAGKGSIDEKAVDEIIKDIQRTLISGDVEVKLVFELSRRIRERALQKPPAGITVKEHVIKTVYDEMVALLGVQPAEIPVKPTRILLIGLFGSGKTTTAGKLALFYQKRGLKVGLIGCDVHRPAAPEQLKQIADKIHVNCYIDKAEKDATRILRKGIEELEDSKVTIVDSAGRDALDPILIDEIKNLSDILQPEEILLVIPADIGQSARKQAEEFRKALNITGVIITKLDSTAKGGGALSACYAAQAPVKFIGVGEQSDALETYDPQRFVSRLLGMGDLQSLLEKAKEIGVDEKSAEQMIKGDFTLRDFYNQLEAMKKMGPLKKVLDMIPGMGGQLPDDMVNIQEGKLQKYKHIMQSMTPKELDDPELIDSSRIERIAKGSGARPEEVRELLKQHKQSKKMLKMFKGGRIRKGPYANLFKNFKG